MGVLLQLSNSRSREYGGITIYQVMILVVPTSLSTHSCGTGGQGLSVKNDGCHCDFREDEGGEEGNQIADDALDLGREKAVESVSCMVKSRHSLEKGQRVRYI